MGRKRQEVIVRNPEPAQEPGAVTQALIPLLRAVVSGVLVSAVLVFGWQVWRGVWLDLPTAGLICALVSLVIWGLSTWGDLLTWGIEDVLDRDISGDGVVGNPDRLILVNARPQVDPRERKRLQFEDFVKGCETDTALRRWEPVIGRERYQEYRDALIGTTWGRWVDPDNVKRGWELAAEPGEIIAALG